jgi:hypothetical protein
VFDGVEIPGLDDGPGFAVVLNHPCSMRSNGVDLVERLQLARVTAYQEVPLNAWQRHHQRVMPLPDLIDGAHYAVQYSDFGLVRSGTLDLNRRVACMDPLGINLLHPGRPHVETEGFQSGEAVSHHHQTPRGPFDRAGSHHGEARPGNRHGCHRPVNTYVDAVEPAGLSRTRANNSAAA